MTHQTSVWTTTQHSIKMTKKKKENPIKYPYLDILFFYGTPENEWHRFYSYKTMLYSFHSSSVLVDINTRMKTHTEIQQARFCAINFGERLWLCLCMRQREEKCIRSLLYPKQPTEMQLCCCGSWCFCCGRRRLYRSVAPLGFRNVPLHFFSSVLRLGCLCSAKY